MNILILGTGAREHALAWKIRQSPRVHNVFLHPGNAGTELQFPLLPGNPKELSELVEVSKKEKMDLIVIGPEAYLAEGYADAFRKEGFFVVGPGRRGAQLETSKIFAKKFMDRAGIPTAPYFIVDTKNELLAKIKGNEAWPIVLKLDGLAAGKGVCIAQSETDVENFADRIWEKKEFGEGPHRILVEEYIAGTELSYIGWCDGNTFLPMETATDYKRLKEGNTGPNTGGMGAISPSPFWNSSLEKKINERIVTPILNLLRKEAIPYHGALFIGLMIDSLGDPFVLEFNTRFGDPETEATLLRLESDLVPILMHTALGTLKICDPPKWSASTSLYVVAAAHGYPEAVRKGDKIQGLSEIDKDIVLFFAGVSNGEEGLITHGGRVLGLGAVGVGIEPLRKKVYSNLERFEFSGKQYRKDIGKFPTP